MNIYIYKETDEVKASRVELLHGMTDTLTVCLISAL